jgi:hypothetical protein
MMKLLRQWGFPVGLLVLWAIAAAYTLNALAGTESTQIPVIAGPTVVIHASDTAHA